MSGLTQAVTNTLAARPSRRGFLGFAGRAALAAGFWLSGASLAEAQSCQPCFGVPCPECDSPHPQCVGCIEGSGCPGDCTQSSWACCPNNQCGGAAVICAECTCPTGCCHCFVCSQILCSKRGSAAR